MSEVAQTQAAEGVKFAAIKAAFDSSVQTSDTKFHFKKVVDKESGVESKRPTVEIPLPYPSLQGVVGILESGDAKAQQLLLDAMKEVVAAHAREIINENENITAENFPYGRLAWQFIADLPAAERRGGGISKDDWKEFAETYIEIMPSVTGKSVEQVTQVAKVLLLKLQPVRMNKKILSAIKNNLTLFASQPQAEDYVDCIEFLTNKADKLINMKEEDLMDNLGLS